MSFLAQKAVKEARSQERRKKGYNDGDENKERGYVHQTVAAMKAYKKKRSLVSPSRGPMPA